MPKYNVDEIPGILDPIEFTLEGRDYVINKVDPDTMSDVYDMAKDATDPNSERGMRGLHARQLAKFTGKDQSEFEGVDLRKTTALIDWITEQITDQAAAKEARKKSKGRR